MQNDISTAKKFRDDYFQRLGHGLNEHTMISCMLEYAATFNAKQNSSVDVETLLADNESLKGKINVLEQTVDHKITAFENMREKNITLQNTIDEKDNVIQSLESDLSKLESNVVESDVQAIESKPKAAAKKK